MHPESLVPLGPIVNVHGIRGELRLLPFNPDSTTLRPGSTVLLRRPTGVTTHRVSTVRPHKRFLLLTLDGCTTRTEAEALVGSEVCVRATDLPPTGADEIYHHELIGMTVETVDGTALGTIVSVLATGSNDVCVVQDGPREHLIPLIADVVRDVDRPGRRLVIEPIPGLLDA